MRAYCKQLSAKKEPNEAELKFVNRMYAKFAERADADGNQ